MRVSVKWIKMTEDRAQCLLLLKTIMSFQAPQNLYGFITKLRDCLLFIDDSNPWSWVVTYLAEV
jgi:hypothetical protein